MALLLIAEGQALSGSTLAVLLESLVTVLHFQKKGCAVAPNNMNDKPTHYLIEVELKSHLNKQAMVALRTTEFHNSNPAWTPLLVKWPTCIAHKV